MGAIVKELLHWNPVAPLGKESIHIPVRRVWCLNVQKTAPSTQTIKTAKCNGGSEGEGNDDGV